MFKMEVKFTIDKFLLALLFLSLFAVIAVPRIYFSLKKGKKFYGLIWLFYFGFAITLIIIIHFIYEQPYTFLLLALLVLLFHFLNYSLFESRVKVMLDSREECYLNFFSRTLPIIIAITMVLLLLIYALYVSFPDTG